MAQPFPASKKVPPAGLFSQKSKSHHSPNLESQTLILAPGLLAQKPKRHHSPNLESRIFLDKCGRHFSHATSTFQVSLTTLSKISDKVETREFCSSHYIAMTEKGKRTALLLAVGEIGIYVKLHPPRTSRLAKMLNLSSHPIGHSQQSLSKYSASFPPIIPLQTSYTRTRVSHIMRVKSKSIPYHAFPLPFPLPLLLPTRQGEREQVASTWNQASSQELTAWNLLPDCLPGIALEYSPSTSCASGEDTTFSWGTDRANKKDTMKHVETKRSKALADSSTILSTSKSIPYHQDRTYSRFEGLVLTLKFWSRLAPLEETGKSSSSVQE